MSALAVVGIILRGLAYAWCAAVVVFVGVGATCMAWDAWQETALRRRQTRSGYTKRGVMVASSKPVTLGAYETLECWGGPLDGERYAIQPSPAYTRDFDRWVWRDHARRSAS